MQVANVKQSNVCHGRGEVYSFGAKTCVLYNLQHNNYDNNLVKDSCWKKVAGEWQCTSSGRGVAGLWQGGTRGTAWRTAWDLHGMCDPAFSVPHLLLFAATPNILYEEHNFVLAMPKISVSF
jgi:hypothetical protein